MDANMMDIKTSLIWAVRKGRLEIARELINSYGLSYSHAWSQGYVLLRHAVENKHTAVAELLLTSGAKVNCKNKNPRDTPLHVSCRYGDVEIVKMLLDKGADVKIEDRFGRTPLHRTIEHMEWEIREAKKSLKQRHGVNPRDNDVTNHLHVAIDIKFFQIVVQLLNSGADVNCICTGTFKKGYTPLHFAVEARSKEVVKFLLSRGAIVDVQAENGTPLLIAAKHAPIDIAEGHFIQARSKKRTDYKQEEIIKLLINLGADVNTQDEDGKTPIFYAITNGDLTMTNLLLTNGASIKHSPDLLNIAVSKECIEIVKALLQHDADVNARDKNGRTALHGTAISNYYDGDIKGEIAELLLSKGARVDAQTKSGATTLFAAIEKKYIKVVEALLKYNANVNFRGNKGITPLHLSADRGNEEIITILLNKGAHVNATQNDGTTALHIAMERNKKEVVKLLLERGANLDLEMNCGSKPLHRVAKRGYKEICETLLKFGADIHSRDANGRTALYNAIAYGNKEAVVTLLEYGSDINMTCGKGRTPLDDAMFYYHDDIKFYNFPITEALRRHIVKMKTADLYVSEQNLQAMSRCGEISGFQDACEEEITRMKQEKINCQNISFYDILAKGTSSLAICMRNANIKWALQAGLYKNKFPIYATMINCHFRKAMQRSDLLEQGNKMFHIFLNSFPKLPYDCTEKIFSYLSNENLKNLLDACKPRL